MTDPANDGLASPEQDVTAELRFPGRRVVAACEVNLLEEDTGTDVRHVAENVWTKIPAGAVRSLRLQLGPR